MQLMLNYFQPAHNYIALGNSLNWSKLQFLSNVKRCPKFQQSLVTIFLWTVLPFFRGRSQIWEKLQKAKKGFHRHILLLQRFMSQISFLVFGQSCLELFLSFKRIKTPCSAIPKNLCPCPVSFALLNKIFHFSFANKVFS